MPIWYNVRPMQDYLYSTFSLAALAITLITDFKLLFRRRKEAAAYVVYYRGFLKGVLAYYFSDAAWGILAGLGWTRALYIDTILYFLSLVAFVFMLQRFISAYLNLGKWTTRALTWYGGALLVLNIVLMVANVFNNCFFYFDEQGTYFIGEKRYLAFSFLVAYNFFIAAAVLVQSIKSRDTLRRRSAMVLLFCITVSAAIILQVAWPLTPFTSLGCLISISFMHVFVIQEEQSAKHTAELENALKRAREAEKARSMFFSIVSHDIRTPLNAILGYSELLQSGSLDKEEKDEALESIRASGTTLLQLVNDVLDLAKLDAGKMILKPAPLKLPRLAEEVFASFRMVAAGKGIELRNMTDEVPAVMLDEHRFRQILFNLVGNAVKFTSRGSITVAASYSGSNLEVSVADTGCGIAPDMLTRILEPFVQIQDTNHAADRAAGTGLGLSICKSLAETMGGELVVESEPWKGSTFKVRIPGVEECNTKEVPAAVREEAGRPAQLPHHVLVVDDSPVNRSVLTAFLKKAGVESIGQACDGAEALSELDSASKAGKAYDFVFTDFWMPNMNGMEFIEKLRADPRISAIPVFAVTADTEFHGDARHDLFNGVLLKPLTYAKLVDTFTSVNK